MPPDAQSRSCIHSSIASRAAARAFGSYSVHLMLMDGALDRIAAARDRMEEGEDPENNPLLAAAVLIVAELRSNLDLRGGDPLTVNLDDLYHYMSRQLVTANLCNQVATLDEVSHLLHEVRSAWAATTYV